MELRHKSAEGVLGTWSRVAVASGWETVSDAGQNVYACELRIRAYNCGTRKPSEWSEVAKLEDEKTESVLRAEREKQEAKELAAASIASRRQPVRKQISGKATKVCEASWSCALAARHGSRLVRHQQGAVFGAVLPSSAPPHHRTERSRRHLLAAWMVALVAAWMVALRGPAPSCQASCVRCWCPGDFGGRHRHDHS